MSDSHSTSKLDDCQLITLDTNHHENGNLSVVENAGGVAFLIEIDQIQHNAHRNQHNQLRIPGHIKEITRPQKKYPAVCVI